LKAGSRRKPFSRGHRNVPVCIVDSLSGYLVCSKVTQTIVVDVVVVVVVDIETKEIGAKRFQGGVKWATVN
jgi:hypothetical protein